VLLFWFHPDFDNSIEARNALKVWSEPLKGAQHRGRGQPEGLPQSEARNALKAWSGPLKGCAAPRVEDTAQRYCKPEARNQGRPKAD